MGHRVDVSPPLLSILSLVLPQTPDRLISRFFLNLRAIYHHNKSTIAGQTAVSALSPIRTHPFWRRPHRSTTGFSVGLEAEASTDGDLANRKEGHAESVDLDVAMELRSRQDGHEYDVNSAADVIPTDEK
jgi:hypothetical protein